MFLLITLSAIIAIIFTVFYLYANRKLDYWEKQNVPHLKPLPFFGNFFSFITLREFSGETANKICQKFPNDPYVGAYYGTEPTLLIKDPDIINLIDIKDFYYFSSREVSGYTHREVTTQNMFFSQGDRWKVVRQNLTPLFSSSKMKKMFYLIQNCSDQLEEILHLESQTSDCVNMKPVTSRYTIDCISACAFGIDSNAMEKDYVNNAFFKIGNLFFDSSYGRGAKLAARAIWPSVFYGLGFQLFPNQLHEFFYKILYRVFEERKSQTQPRNDFVDLMLSLKKNKFISGDSISNMKTGAEKTKTELEVTDELIAAHCVMFFAAGFETSAATLSYTIYELSKNFEAQNRVIAEIDEYLKTRNGQVEYDCVTELPYTEACVDETLRMYPILGIITREVVEDYTLPTGVFLEKGLRVHLPVYHLHYDPKVFPNPEQFIPERFFGEAKNNIRPHTYMPFGDGGRICIGKRFAKMQVLAGIVKVFKNYRVEFAKGMPKKLDFVPTSLVTQQVGPINVKLVRRT